MVKTNGQIARDREQGKDNSSPIKQQIQEKLQVWGTTKWR